MAQERAIQMSKHSSFNADINKRVVEKLAGLKELVAPSLIGAGALTGLTAIPTLLNAYANDKDAGKSLASAAQYTIPLGALAGAGFGGGHAALGRLKTLASELINDVAGRLPSTESMSNVLKGVYSDMAPHARALSDSGRNFFDSGSNAVRNVGEASRNMINSFGNAAQSLADSAEDAGTMFARESRDTANAGAKAIEDFIRGDV